MKFTFLAVALAMTASTNAATPPAPAKQDVVAFNASVRVEVDAAGKPVKVEAPADLPDAIRAYIEKRVASWQYQPATQAGMAVPAVTYVQVAACAVPSRAGDTFTLAADFDGNGPRNAGDQRIVPPKYPGAAMRNGDEAEFKVILNYAEDGKASLEMIEKADLARKVHISEFELELRRWAKTLRFDPEQVAGQPVAGRVRITVNFTMASRTMSEWRAKRDEVAATINASRECRMAKGDSAMRPVAVESVVKVTPTPSS